MKNDTNKKASLKKDAPKKAALLGILAAEALALSFIEGLIPEFLPIPGAKPGFSNIVTMFAVSSFGFSYGFAITLFKAVFALLTRGATASLMSLSGGILSLLVMTLLFRMKNKHFGYIGIGILSASAHNVGQLSAAVLILGKTVLALTPYLLIMSIVTGLLTGMIFKYTIPALQKQTNIFFKSSGETNRKVNNKE